jgi:CDP-diglyceride synthetase
MTYFVYFLFVVWLLSGLGGLLAGALIRFGPPNAPRVSPKPAWFQFLTGFYTLAVAAVLFWLYRGGAITEWWVLILGSVIFIPELLFMVLGRGRSR